MPITTPSLTKPKLVTPALPRLYLPGQSRAGRQAGYFAISDYNWGAQVSADNRYLWLTSNANNLLYRVNLDTRTIEATYALSPNGFTAMGFALDTNANVAYVGHETNGLTNQTLVSKVNLTTGVETDIAFGTANQHARGFDQDSTYIYVGCGAVAAENANLARINKSTGVVTLLSLGVSADIWFAVKVVGTKCYVGLSTGQVVVVNLSTFTVSSTIANNSTNDVRSLVYDGSRYIYGGCYGADHVGVWDTSNDSFVKTLATGSWPMGVALTPDNAYLYVHETFLNQYGAFRLSDGIKVIASTQLYPNAQQAGFGQAAMQTDGALVYFNTNVGPKTGGTGYQNAVAVTV